MRKIVPLFFALSMLFAAAAWGGATPAVTTGSASAVGTVGAHLHGTVNPEGVATTYFFRYGLTTAYTTTTPVTSAGSGSRRVSEAAAITGLDPGTTYHYQIVATNGFGTSVGADQAFTTSGHPLPAAITGPPTAITTSTATLTGTVVTQDETTTVYFDYGPTPAYGLQTAAQNATASLTPTGVAATLTNLAPGATIYYRLVAIHAGFPLEDGAAATLTTVPLKPLRARLTAHTTPRHARHRPFVFTTAGRLAGPSSLLPGVGCSGIVNVRFLLGHRTVAFRKVPVQTNCTYAVQVLFRHRIARQTTRPTVEARFSGNRYLRPARARGQRLTLG
jgi:hypothetical protein